MPGTVLDASIPLSISTTQHLKGKAWFDLFLEEDNALLILGDPRGNFPKEVIGQMMQ